MNIFKSTYILPAALIALAFTACDDDDDFQRAGEPSVEDAGVYFPSSNTTEFIKTEQEAKSVDITLARANAEGELTVPIKVVSKTDNIDNVPAQATFADGATETTITITFADLATTPKCTLQIPEEYTNPYKKKDGSSTFAFNIYKLKLISANVKYSGDTSPYYFNEVTTSQLLQFEGENKFIWRNFLGSGIDLKFKINGNFDAEDVYKCNGEIVPLDHSQSDSDGWYLLNDKRSYATWTPEGSSLSINNYMYFWSQSDGNNYCSINLKKNASNKGDYGYAYVNSAVIDDESTYYSFYTYFYY